MSVAAPPSPGAPSEVDVEDEAPDAGADGAAGSEETEATDSTKRRLLTFYAKNYYEINPEHVLVDKNNPYPMDSGLSMYQLHESKSFKVWDEDYVVRPGNIIKIVAGGQVGWYICFEQEGVGSSDHMVARAIHKQIAKRFYDQWHKDWKPERKARHAELLRDEPSDLAQINPLVVGWAPLKETLGEILYERPKKEKKDKSDGPLQGAIAKAGGKAKNKPAKMAVLDDDDDQSSAAASAPPATPSDTALVGFRQPPQQMGMSSSAPNIFLQTPGMPHCLHTTLSSLLSSM